MSARMHRRSFLKTSTAAVAGVYAAQLMPAWAEASPAPLPVFPYRDVELLAGPLKQQFDYHHQLFLNLDDDRMLKVFRQRAGLPAPGENMGGWYDLEGFDLAHDKWRGFVPGHSFGQYVSGLRSLDRRSHSPGCGVGKRRCRTPPLGDERRRRNPWSRLKPARPSRPTRPVCCWRC